MTIEEEIQYQKNLINEKLRDIKIYKLAIKGLIGEQPDNVVEILIAIAQKVVTEISTIETSDKIIDQLKVRLEGKNGESI